MPPSLARTGTGERWELPCSIPILSLLLQSELIPVQGEEEEEAEARGEGLCPWSEFLSPHIRSFWELWPIPGEDGVPGPGLCMV